MIVDLCIDTPGLLVCLYSSFTKSWSFESISVVGWFGRFSDCVVGIEGVLIA